MPKKDRTSQLNKQAFFEDLGYEPHAGQQLLHASRASRRVVACGVRWGKTKSAAYEGLAAAMEPAQSSCGWVVAPTYDLADKVFREIFFVAHEKLKPYVIEAKESERKLLIHNIGGGVSEIRGKTADNPVSLLGEGLDWLIVDEAARLKPSIWEGHLTQRLLDKNGWALLISTPKGKGWYYDAFRRGQNGKDPDCESWNAPTWQNPHVSRELIEAERTRLPERVFNQEYGGEFLEGMGQVFRGIRDAATLELQDPQKERVYFAGIDLAKVEDFTVIVVLNDLGELVAMDRFHRIDWSQQIERLKNVVDKYDPVATYVDSTGIGEPIFEQLAQAGMNAYAYKLTNQSKAKMIDNLAVMFEKQQIKLPRTELVPDLVDELEAFEFSVTDFGAVKSGAPSGTHDDCVIALGLAAWGLNMNSRVPMVY